MRCELIAVEGFTLEAFQIYQWFQHDVLGYREKTEKKDGRNTGSMILKKHLVRLKQRYQVGKKTN